MRSTPLSGNSAGETRLRVLRTRNSGPDRSPVVLVETRYDAKSKIRVCIRTLQSFLNVDVSQLQIQVCRYSADGTCLEAVRPVSFSRFRKLVVDTWIFTQIRRGRLMCYFQPIVDSRQPDQPEVFGHEALIRCPMPGGLTLRAKELFALAYSPELVRELHLATLWCGLRGSQKIRGAGKLFVKTNPGLVDTGRPFWARVTNLMKENEVPLDDIVFEIVQSQQPRDVDVVLKFCRKSRAAGFRVALDEFGAQTAPFQLLMDIRPDYVKLEPKLISRCIDDRWKRCIAENLISLCRKLSIPCIAEGIADNNELEWANQQRAPLIQGSKFGRPSPDPVSLVNTRAPHQHRPYFRAISLSALLNSQPVAGR